MNAGEGGASGVNRTLALRALAGRRATFPALVLALAVFCTQGVGVLTSVVREDLAAPPLVDVSPIDLGASPTRVVTRLESVGAEAAPAPMELVAAAPDMAASTALPLEALGTAVEAPAPSPSANETITLASVPAVPDGESGVVTASAPEHQAQPATPPGARRRAASGSAEPPPGRPVGPECDGKPGRRAACARTQPT